MRKLPLTLTTNVPRGNVLPIFAYPEGNDITGNSSKESSEPYDEVVSHHAVS